MPIIGIAGKSQSGKDVFGNALLNHFANDGKIFEIKKFATLLKQSIELKFPNLFSVKEWEKGGKDYRDFYISSLQMTRRQLLIAEGMALREIYRDYWIISLFNQYYNSKWIITDMRFPNEFNEIKRLGGVCIKIQRKNTPSIDSISETSLDTGFKFDYVIQNNGSEAELIEQAKLIYILIK